MENFTVIREIGKGAYGQAFMVQEKATAQRYVLKKVRLARQSFKERQASLRELQLMCSLCHRNILQCKEAWVEAGCIVCMLVELCESGDLATQLRIRAPMLSYFPEGHLQEMLVALASGLAYVHKNNIVHRDIKSSNIFITAAGCLKLADFGLASVLDSEVSTSHTLVGTPGYMAPQLLGEGRIEYDGRANDIWGLGCVLYEASALKQAFTAFNMAGLVKKVTTCSVPPLPGQYSERWRALIKSMLVKEESKRPTADEILALPWLQEARQRVEGRFGPELPPGADEFVLLRALPDGIQKLAEQFRQQQEEQEEKHRVDNERRKVLQAKYAPRGLLQKQAQQDLAALNLAPEQQHDLLAPAAVAGGAGAGGAAGAGAGPGAGRKPGGTAPAPAALRRAGAHTAAARRPGQAPPLGRGAGGRYAAAHRASDLGQVSPAPWPRPGRARPAGAPRTAHASEASGSDGSNGGEGLPLGALSSPQRPGSAPPSPSRISQDHPWDDGDDGPKPMPREMSGGAAGAPASSVAHSAFKPQLCAPAGGPAASHAHRHSVEALPHVARHRTPSQDSDAARAATATAAPSKPSALWGLRHSLSHSETPGVPLAPAPGMAPMAAAAGGGGGTDRAVVLHKSASAVHALLASCSSAAAAASPLQQHGEGAAALRLQAAAAAAVPKLPTTTVARATPVGAEVVTSITPRTSGSPALRPAAPVAVAAGGGKGGVGEQSGAAAVVAGTTFTTARTPSPGMAGSGGAGGAAHRTPSPGARGVLAPKH